jgi:predicted nuclease with TOPRIM domain
MSEKSAMDRHLDYQRDRADEAVEECNTLRKTNAALESAFNQARMEVKRAERQRDKYKQHHETVASQITDERKSHALEVKLLRYDVELLQTITRGNLLHEKNKKMMELVKYSSALRTKNDELQAEVERLKTEQCPHDYGLLKQIEPKYTEAVKRIGELEAEMKADYYKLVWHILPKVPMMDRGQEWIDMQAKAAAILERGRGI